VLDKAHRLKIRRTINQKGNLIHSLIYLERILKLRVLEKYNLIKETQMRSKIFMKSKIVIRNLTKSKKGHLQKVLFAPKHKNHPRQKNNQKLLKNKLMNYSENLNNAKKDVFLDSTYI
jgi:histidinol phosphatase-like enzyme